MTKNLKKAVEQLQNNNDNPIMILGNCKTGYTILTFGSLKYIGKNEWIPTSERLPKEDGEYLVSDKLYDNINVSYVIRYSNFEFIGAYNNVVAWIESV